MWLQPFSLDCTDRHLTLCYNYPTNVTSWISLHILSQEIALVRGQLHISRKHQLHLIWELREACDTQPTSGSIATDVAADECLFVPEFMATTPRLKPCWNLMMCCQTKTVQTYRNLLAMLNVILIIHLFHTEVKMCTILCHLYHSILSLGFYVFTTKWV